VRCILGDPITIQSRDLLQTLLAETAETDPEMLPPTSPIDDGEKVIGTVDDDYIKRIFSLASFYRRESQRMQVDLQAIGDEPSNSPSFNQLKQKYETLQEIFWFLLRAHYNHWGMGIGVRRNWKVVNTDGNKSSKLPAVLRRLLEE